MCYPPLEAWDQLAAIFQAAYRSDGADLLIGRKLTAMLRDAGLVDVGADARADVYPAGHPRRTILPDLVRSMHDKMIRAGHRLAGRPGPPRPAGPRTPGQTGDPDHVLPVLPGLGKKAGRVMR